MQEGIKLTKSVIVETKHTAKNLGSGNLDVLGTPALVAFMENAAKECVSPFVPESSDTVGIKIEMEHIKASKVGSEINTTATLGKIDGKKLIFSIISEENGVKIGFGTHERIIIDTENFLAKL